MLQLVLRQSKLLNLAPRVCVNCEKNGRGAVVLVSAVRFKHRNHPGHKPKPLAIPEKYELPDRYVDEPLYPPVRPKYPPGGAWSPGYDPQRAWHYYAEGQKFHSLKTIQERMSVMAYLNVQQTLNDLSERKTRWYPIFQVSTLYNTPRMLPFTQFITKTHIKDVDSLPSLSQKTTSTADVPGDGKQPRQQVQLNESISTDLYEKLKHRAKEAILLNYNKLDLSIVAPAQPPQHPDTYIPKQVEREQQVEKQLDNSNRLIRTMFDAVTSGLASVDSHEHLRQAHYGNDVAIRAYWKKDGFEAERPRGAIHPDPDTIRFQFDDVAAYQIKCENPLKPICKIDSSESIESKVPDYAYKPTMFKIFSDHILPSQVPGHWYGEPREFNFLTVLNTTRTSSYIADKFPESSEILEPYKSMAIMSGHAELTAQAYYLGFSMWKDLTYPLFAQYILTDGQTYSFANYQLNTIRLWNKATPANNLCYITKPQVLFELNEAKTDFKSFNDDLFKNLLNMLSNRPMQNHTELVEKYSEVDHMVGGTRLRPYLSIQNFEEQLTTRHQLFAISLYELVKYDRPMSYLLYRSNTVGQGDKPKFHRLYSRYTYDFRDIVLKYYPRDYYGFQLLERLLRKSPKQTEKFWDMKTPVYEWANVPPPDINNIPRDIRLPKF